MGSRWLIHQLAKIPWRTFVFEGHEHEEHYDQVVDLMDKKCNATLARSHTLKDGDSSSRLLMIFLRNQHHWSSEL